jgi:hypothetical protein
MGTHQLLNRAANSYSGYITRNDFVPEDCALRAVLPGE